MSRGESAVFVVPAELMRAQPPPPPADPPATQQQQQLPCLLPDPPAKAVQVEVQLELISLVQV